MIHGCFVNPLYRIIHLPAHLLRCRSTAARGAGLGEAEYVELRKLIGSEVEASVLDFLVDDPLREKVTSVSSFSVTLITSSWLVVTDVTLFLRFLCAFCNR